MPKYPHVQLQMISDRETYLSLVTRAVLEMERGGVSEEEIETFRNEVFSLSYEELLETLDRWMSFDQIILDPETEMWNSLMEFRNEYSDAL